MYHRIPIQSKDLGSRGFLNFVEIHQLVPHQVNRIFAIGNVSPGELRGGHAHKTCWQSIWLVTGETVLHLKNKGEQNSVLTISSDELIVIPPLSWLEFRDLNANQVVIVFASHTYDKDDYIHSLEDLANYFD